MNPALPLRSFWMGGFECSSHRRHDRRRLDLLEATGHDRLARRDYLRMQQHGLRTVRDGLRWHLIETKPGFYDFSSFVPMLEAARATGTQVIWDLCHYGWPDDLDIWRPTFVDRFAAFAASAARVVREGSDEIPIYCPINEISYWAWAGGDHGRFNPWATGRGLELKQQLVRATLAAVRAVREVDPRARFIQIDPLIKVHARDAGSVEAAAAYSRAQYEAWRMTSGELWPGLGGAPELLDAVGVNYYSDNQWAIGGEPDDADDAGAGVMLPDQDPRATPLHRLLHEAHAVLGRPMILAETGAEGARRAPWLRHVADEVELARQAGVPVQGICLYPVLDYPGWDDERPCPTGLYGNADEAGERPLASDLAAELGRQTARFTSTRLP